MSNIAGKAYAMNLVSAIDGVRNRLLNKATFWLVGTRLFRGKLNGLATLSMIHYARWVIVKGSEFPRLADSQPRESLQYSYMFFFSNFNGSWAQYIDSFSAAIPSGLDLLWARNVGWPHAVPEQPFHRWITHNQLFTNHYYSAYPMAASNDVKAGKRVLDGLRDFVRTTENMNADSFADRYTILLKDLQHDLGQMAPTPIVSLAAEAAADRGRRGDRAANNGGASAKPN